MAVTTRGTRKKQEKKEELLSLNNPKKPTYKSGDDFKSTSNASRTAALKDTLKPKDNEISQAEMDDIDRQIKKMQKDKKKVTEKDVEKVSGKKVVTRNGKKGFLFGKGAKFRPFGGVLARALLGDDEKFGGERGLIDFVRTKKKPAKKAKGGEMMKAKGYHRGGVAAKTSAKKTSRRPAPKEEKLAAGRRAPARGGVKRRPTRPPQPVRQMPEMSEVKRRPTRQMPEMSGVKRRPSRPMPRMPEMSGVKRRPSRPMPRMPQAPQMGGVKARPTQSQMSSASPSRPTRQMPQTGGVKRRPPSMPRFGGRRMPMMQSGGMAMNSKMASKGGKMGGKMAPGYKNGGSVGKKKARGVGAAKRGFGRAMR